MLHNCRVYLISALVFLMISPGHVAYAAEDAVEDKGGSGKEEESPEDVIRSMSEYFSGNNYNDVEKAVFFFEEMGKDGIPYLVSILKEKGDDKRTSNNVIYTLGRLGNDAKEAVPVIIPFLRNDDADTKATAAIALGKIGNASRGAVPMLIHMLRDSDEWVRKKAAEALERIGGDNARKAVSSYKKRKNN